MAEPVDDGPARARATFLQGCSLPKAWAGRRQWRILETRFGAALNFLATWQAWRDDPQRPTVLHFASIEARPVSAEDLLRSAATHAQLQPLARELASRWWGLVAGWHRLSFDGGLVLLTVAVGDPQAVLAEQDFEADSVFLDSPTPALVPAVAKCCRRGSRVAAAPAQSDVRREMAQCGFVIEDVSHGLRAVFDPPWEPRGVRPAPAAPEEAVVIGAGLAGSAVAAALARRGTRVLVLDAAETPAAGASALPAGLLAPHTSHDDNLLSRLSRAGVRLTLSEAAAMLESGRDGSRSGALELRDDPRPLPPLGEEQAPWQSPIEHEGRPAILHEAAAWVRPGALVRAWLDEPGVTFQGGVHVSRLQRDGDAWTVLGAQGQLLARSSTVAVAAALASGDLLPGTLPLHPVRGQVTWGLHSGDALTPRPLNGNGHFLPDVPLPDGSAWLTGSTYGRGDTGLDPREEDHAANLARLQGLDPSIAARVAPAFASGQVRAWTGVRCASQDRRPLVGEVAPGLWVSTAMGSRGLTFAALCAQLLAARLFGEPLPLPRRLAAALDVGRALRPGAAAPSA